VRFRAPAICKVSAAPVPQQRAVEIIGEGLMQNPFMLKLKALF